MFDVGLPGVDGLPGLAAHVVDVGAELPGPAQVDRHAHGQLLQTLSFLRQPDGLRVFLRENRRNKVSRRKVREAQDAPLGPASPHLSEPSHRLAGDDLIAVQAGDEAQGLVLVLSSFQLTQDQSPEYLDILEQTLGRR